MASRPSPNSKSPKSGRSETVLGRSAATGRFVLAPASKHASITVKRATEAANTVLRGKS